MVLLFGVAIAGEAERFDGVSIEETYRAFPKNATPAIPMRSVRECGILRPV